MKKIALLIKDASVIPEACKNFFPPSIDGYAYLVIRDRTALVEFWREFYPDSHPWKDYHGSTELYARIGRKEAANLLRSVRQWNQVADKRAAKAQAAHAAKVATIDAWIASLPLEIAGYTREGDGLYDSYGNHCFNLPALGWNKDGSYCAPSDLAGRIRAMMIEEE